jgi:hypothetical protein
MGSGEGCLSGQPPAPGDTLLALLTLLVLLGLAWPAIPGPVRLIRSAWRRRPDRAPPWLAGRDLLNVVCVART